jgi:hypothetical protein
MLILVPLIGQCNMDAVGGDKVLQGEPRPSMVFLHLVIQTGLLKLVDEQLTTCY